MYCSCDAKHNFSYSLQCRVFHLPTSLYNIVASFLLFFFLIHNNFTVFYLFVRISSQHYRMNKKNMIYSTEKNSLQCDNKQEKKETLVFKIISTWNWCQQIFCVLSQFTFFHEFILRFFFAFSFYLATLHSMCSFFRFFKRHDDAQLIFFCHHFICDAFDLLWTSWYSIFFAWK